MADERDIEKNVDNMIQFVRDLMKDKVSNNNKFAILKLFFPKDEMFVPDETLIKLYKTKATEHNFEIINNPYADSGFDLFVPYAVEFNNTLEAKFVDLKIKAEMLYYDINLNTITPSPFQIYPRSSISKTPLMLANHTGIIDAGYRGNLIAAFRNLYADSYHVEKYTRLVQICHPTLCPIFVIFIRNDSELSTTARGNGGFGSTG